MPKAGDNQFTPIHDEKTVSRYLHYMLDLHARVHCAVRETDIRFDTEPIQILNDKVIHLKMQTETISPDNLKTAVKNTKSQHIDISYHAHDILIFAATRLKQVDKEGLSVEVERPIYKLQRREHLRVKPGTDVKCLLKLTNPRDGSSKEYVPYDISVGGFALVLTEAEAQPFAAGDIYAGTEFTFGGIQARVDAVVKNKIPIQDSQDSNVKIGFTIIAGLPSRLEHEISRYAYMVSQKILGRRI